MAQSSVTRLTTTKTYDNINRLTKISSVPSGGNTMSFGYQYNAANQRLGVTNADNSRWSYAYDALGQVVTGKKYGSDTYQVPGQQFEYSYDDIGNRKTAGFGGDGTGGSSGIRYATYTPNSLNQYSSRTVPGYVQSLGSARSDATVTLWNQDGTYGTTYRRDTYFRAELAVNNTAVLWVTMTNLAVLKNGASPDIVTNVVQNVFVPATPEVFTPDLDGNLQSDGRWTYTWNAENRLMSMVSRTAVGPQQLIKFEYDFQGRRIHKQVWPNTSGTGYPTNDVKFIYDGWNLVAELNGTNNTIVRSYVWGLDLSGTPQGAGGVGGLIGVSDAVSGFHFVAFDGNGNPGGLVKSADGTLSATYEYGPFGELLRATGPMAKANSIRFSTKYQDDETDLLYYGYRYYNPSTGRWISRDPVQEEGFGTLRRRKSRVAAPIPINLRESGNLYAFLRNNPANDIDVLGLAECNCMCGKDVTSQVFQTLQDIAETYANASAFRRWEANYSMFGVLSFSSWDILYLYNYVNPGPDVPGCSSCNHTVTFQGMCVRPNELNYIMFGWATQVTYFSDDLALEMLSDGLMARRVVNGESIFSIARKIEFARYGSDFSRNLAPWVEVAPQCHPNTKKLNVDIQNWRWMGLKWPGW